MSATSRCCFVVHGSPCDSAFSAYPGDDADAAAVGAQGAGVFSFDAIPCEHLPHVGWKPRLS